MDEDANIQIKKGQRKSKRDPQPPPEASVEEVQPDEEDTPAVEVPTTKPKKAKAKKPEVEVEDYDVEQLPDVIIHKRHKGAKPRKIIVITGDSDANDSDEDLPYRARSQVQVKSRPKPSTPAPEPTKPKVTKPPKASVVPVQKVSQKANADIGAGLPERYAMTNKPKTGYVVDEFIDKLLGL
jgi:hypothetical protein